MEKKKSAQYISYTPMQMIIMLISTNLSKWDIWYIYIHIYQLTIRDGRLETKAWLNFLASFCLTPERLKRQKSLSDTSIPMFFSLFVSMSPIECHVSDQEHWENARHGNRWWTTVRHFNKCRTRWGLIVTCLLGVTVSQTGSSYSLGGKNNRKFSRILLLLFPYGIIGFTPSKPLPPTLLDRGYAPNTTLVISYPLNVT